MQQQHCTHFAVSFHCTQYCWKLSYAVELEIIRNPPPIVSVMALMEAHIHEDVLLT